MTFFPAPIDIKALFLWGNIAIRCYYRKPGMEYGLMIPEADARRLLSDSTITYSVNGKEYTADMVRMPLSRTEPNDKEEIRKIIEEGEGVMEGQALPMIDFFQNLHLRIDWKKKHRYSVKKWGQIGIAVFITGVVHGHTKDRVLFFNELSVSAENMLKGADYGHE